MHRILLAFFMAAAAWSGPFFSPPPPKAFDFGEGEEEEEEPLEPRAKPSPACAESLALPPRPAQRSDPKALGARAKASVETLFKLVEARKDPACKDSADGLAAIYGEETEDLLETLERLQSWAESTTFEEPVPESDPQ